MRIAGSRGWDRGLVYKLGIRHFVTSAVESFVMKTFPSLLNGWVLAMTLFGLAGSVRSLAFDSFPTHREAEALGLVVQWQAVAERSRIGIGDTQVVVWPHSSLRHQRFIIRVGTRVVEQIDANRIVSLTALTTPAEWAKAGSGLGDSPPQRLGKEAARQEAELIVARYAALGRQATIEEIDQPITFLVTASKDGGVQARDAESGELLWSTAVGVTHLPTLGPGVNDQQVVVTNGVELYALELTTGNLIGRRRLLESPSAGPVPIGDLCYVPTFGGSIAAYDMTRPESEPVTMRFSSPIFSSVTPSLDERFAAWPDERYLYVAQSGNKFSQWNRLEAAAPIHAQPQATADGFIAVSTTGMVYRVNLNRHNALVWRVNLAQQTSRAPFVADGMVVVVSDNGYCFAIDETSGEWLWQAQASDVRQVLSIAPERVYVQRVAGQLGVLDRRTGDVIGGVPRPLAEGARNITNDRIILQSADGSLVCLREQAAVLPKLNIRREATPAPPSSAAPAVEPPGGEAMPAADPFNPPTDAAPGGSPFDAPGDAPAGVMSEDPFAAPAEPPKSDNANPFGL
jgi:outer membrane protein assembly factor BamB